MGDVVLHNAVTVDGTPQELFAFFGQSSAAGWLFSAECDRVSLGAVVSMTCPIGPPGGSSLRILGRLTKVVPSQHIVIGHDQPWSGKTRISFTAVDARRTTVTIRVELDDEGVGWLTRRLGYQQIESQGDTGRAPVQARRVGLLTSKTGPGAIFAGACENLARMAVEELSLDGGLGGLPVELLIGDDGTDARTGVSEARRLIDSGCEVIIASVTSSTFEAVQHALAHRGVGLVHAVRNEGGIARGNVLRWGERPSDQLGAAAETFMSDTGAKNWFLVGNDYSWSHGAHSTARRLLPAGGGRITGERLLALGTVDFESTISKILSSGADCVLSSLVGADEVAFERQAFEAGLRDRTKTLSLVLEESTHERIGPEAAAGLWTASGYFESLDTPANRDFVARYRQRFGRWAPPISSFSEGVYEAIKLYAAASRTREGSGDPSTAARAMTQSAAEFPRGAVRAEGPNRMNQTMYVAQSSGETFDVIAAR